MIATVSFLVSSTQRSSLRAGCVSAFQQHYVSLSSSINSNHYDYSRQHNQGTHFKSYSRRQVSRFMSSTSSSTSTSTSTTNNNNNNIIMKRVKTIDAVPSPETVAIKGWVRTVRKQKTLAFVEVNDGSTLSGIQCVLPFDELDEDSKAGR
jgi:hypothetical protein